MWVNPWMYFNSQPIPSPCFQSNFQNIKTHLQQTSCSRQTFESLHSHELFIDMLHNKNLFSQLKLSEVSSTGGSHFKITSPKTLAWFTGQNNWSITPVCVHYRFVAGVNFQVFEWIAGCLPYTEVPTSKEHH